MKLMQLSRRSATLLLGVSLTVCAAAKSPDGPSSSSKRQKSVVILYENDVHCAIDGYAKLAGLRDAIVAADTACVGVVSSGDFLNRRSPRQSRVRLRRAAYDGIAPADQRSRCLHQPL